MIRQIGTNQKLRNEVGWFGGFFDRYLISRLEEFVSSPASRVWLGLLGFQEMSEILSRGSLCVSSEKVVFDLAVAWAEDKV